MPVLRPPHTIMSASKPRTPPPPPPPAPTSSSSAAQSQTRMQIPSAPSTSSTNNGIKPMSYSNIPSQPLRSSQRSMSNVPERNPASLPTFNPRSAGGNGNILSGLLSGSKLAAKARSSVDYITTNAKPVRSALQNASSYIASTTGLIESHVPESNDKEKTWGEWAREWTEKRNQEGKGTEQLYVLPGWCVRVERPGTISDGGWSEFNFLFPAACAD